MVYIHLKRPVRGHRVNKIVNSFANLSKKYPRQYIRPPFLSNKVPCTFKPWKNPVIGQCNHSCTDNKCNVKYCAVRVQHIWEEFLAYRRQLPADLDPYYAKDQKDYMNRMIECKKQIQRFHQSKLLKKESLHVSDFRKINHSIQKAYIENILWEKDMLEVKHQVCRDCHQCSLNLSINKDNVCSNCSPIVPYWIDDSGVKKYDVPAVLTGLTVAEKLLIQRINPLVPMVYIGHGHSGIKGHVCAFVQDVDFVAESLPNLPKNVKIVKVSKRYKNKEGEIITKVYSVRKEKVLNALHWLVRYHSEYRKAFEDGSLNINADNLSWITDPNGCGNLYDYVSSLDLPVNDDKVSLYCFQLTCCFLQIQILDKTFFFQNVYVGPK